MVPHKPTVLGDRGVGIRAELNTAKVYPGLTSRVRTAFLQQKTELLAKEELQHKRTLEEAYSQPFPEGPLALLPSQSATEISCKADRERLSVNAVLSCAIEQELRARDLCLEATQQATELTGHRRSGSLLPAGRLIPSVQR